MLVTPEFRTLFANEELVTALTRAPGWGHVQTLVAIGIVMIINKCRTGTEWVLIYDSEMMTDQDAEDMHEFIDRIPRGSDLVQVIESSRPHPKIPGSAGFLEFSYFDSTVIGTR
ncbi:hypothetical protein [Kitasatospora sp. NPDC127116]|uniref:hypothetical protein n=1 Tax=Kitasatospora sp. NPDC127116 TaxID=3345367 RepID=UPI00364132DB